MGERPRPPGINNHDELPTTTTRRFRQTKTQRHAQPLRYNVDVNMRSDLCWPIRPRFDWGTHR